MELIKGSQSLFYIVRNGIEIPVGCLTSNPIDESAEMMDTTTRDNQGWKTSIPTMQSYSIALDGYMTMDDPNSGKNIVSYRELRKIKRNREQIVWKIKTLNGWYVDSGKAYIESISFTDPVDDMIGFSASLVGYGIPNDLNGEYDIYSDEITYNYTYSHEPVNDPNSGEWFLANLLFNNYFNAFGILYNCDLKVQIASVPVKGFIAHNITKQIFAPDDVISYCEKDNLVYYPNGFNNDLGVSGNFSETFSYKIIDQDGRIGRLTTHTLVMTDSAVEPIDLSVSILWNDNTSEPKTGTEGTIIVKVVNLTFDPSDPIVTQQWEVWNGTDWILYADKTDDIQTIALFYEVNQIRLKVVSNLNITAYSNVLYYTRQNFNVVIYNEEKYIYREKAGGYNNNPQKHWTFPMPNFFVIPEDGGYKFDFIIKKTVNAEYSPNLTVKIGRNRNGSDMNTFTDYVKASNPLVGLNDVKTSSFTRNYNAGDVLDVYYEYYMGGYIRLGLSISIKVTKL